MSLLNLPPLPTQPARGRFIGQPWEEKKPDHLPKMRELRAQGLTLAAIGERFGMSKQSVHRLLRGKTAGGR